jgi:acetyltransferase-like isoleucine patch superfamily enzyme
MNNLRKIKLKIKKLIFSFYSFEKKATSAGVILGSNNFIATSFWSTEPYLIKIGNNCQITNGVKIFTHGGGGAVRKKHPKFDCFGKVVIGDYVYIGNHSLIMPGVSIGDNVLIAAGSVVTKSVPANVVIGGNPAKLICSIEDYIENNIRFNLNSKGMTASDKKKLLLSAPENKFLVKNEMKYSK